MKFLMTIMFALTIVAVNAQDFTFEYAMKELEEVQSSDEVKTHFLGNEVAMKMQLLAESYTYKVEDEITGTAKITVEKPSIYNSVKKTERYLKKGLKKGNITQEEAKLQFDTILNIALNIRYQDTQQLEEVLWDIKDPDQIASLYTSKVKLEM